jgi:hypothetical protein
LMSFWFPLIIFVIIYAVFPFTKEGKEYFEVIYQRRNHK